MIDVWKLREVFRRELEARAVSTPVRFCFSDYRNGEPSLYASAAAVNIHAILGLPLGSRQDRDEWADTLLSFQLSDLSFAEELNLKSHALCMVIQAWNILGVEIPRQIAPLAPLDPAGIARVIAEHDWSSTHKPLSGLTVPLLADGLVSTEWTALLFEQLTKRLSDSQSPNAWYRADDPPCHAISAIYHILKIYHCGRVPWPRPKLLLNRLLGLSWPDARQSQPKTHCTDADWAWMLDQLSMVVPDYAKVVRRQIQLVSRQRAQEWEQGALDLGATSTHHLYCFLWSTAQYQYLDRGVFRGVCIVDTLNDPSRFRLGWNGA